MTEKTFRCLKCDETEVKFYKDLIPYCEKHFPKPKDQAAVKAEVANIIAATAPGVIDARDSAREAVAVLMTTSVEVPKGKDKGKGKGKDTVEVKPVVKTTKTEGGKKVEQHPGVTAKPPATAPVGSPPAAAKTAQDWVVCAKDGEILFSGGKTKKEAQEWAQSQIAINKLRVGQYKVSKVE